MRQRTVYQPTRRRARLQAEDRVFWVVLRRFWSDWTRPLVIVTPETVIVWHRQGFNLFWRHRPTSRKVGRPGISGEYVAFIRRISTDHPEWGEDRFAEEPTAKFGIHHAASTIRRYLVPRRGPRQSVVDARRAQPRRRRRTFRASRSRGKRNEADAAECRSA